MAVVRKNIVSDIASRDGYVQGVRLLKQEDTGQTTADFGIPGTARPVSTYDLFVIWHHRAMMTPTPAPPQPNPSGRNAAHRGPIFLPWHRVMLLFLEQNLQRVLADATFGLPYWDWAADGDTQAGQQPQAAVWGPQCMGGSGDPVSTGPFAFDPTVPTGWRVRVSGTITGGVQSADRGLRRALGDGVAGLPVSSGVTTALGLTPYDQADWDAGSGGFRNRLEGGTAEPSDPTPGLHNRVHNWVGLDMGRTTSPNDPVFYLNHCNVDRIWEGWMQQHGRQYQPGMSAGSFLAGHRVNDPITSPLGAAATPGELLDVSAIYTYDVLP